MPMTMNYFCFKKNLNVIEHLLYLNTLSEIHGINFLKAKKGEINQIPKHHAF